MKKDVLINPKFHEFTSKTAKDWEERKSERYKEYRKKWIDNPRNFIVDNAPLHVDIEATNLCNLKCPMCFRTVKINNLNKDEIFESGYINFDLYKKIIDEAVEIGVYSVKLNWMGEPLMHPRIADMISYAKQKGIEDVMLNTNAVLLTEKMSEEIIAAGLDKIFFSFDSPIKENYEKIRIGANFENTLNNIKKFMEIRNSKEKITCIARTSMVVMENNKEEYNDYIDLFSKIVDIVSHFDCIDWNKEMDDEEGNYKDSEFICSQLWQRICITWDGQAMPCCCDIDKKYILGNVKNNTLKELWNGDKFKKIRELHKNSLWYKCSMCKKCGLASVE